MPYVASNFIGAYAPTSKTLRIMKDGKVSFSINICNYQKSSVSGNYLYISLEDATKEYALEFADNADATSALVSFKQAVDTLRPNCEATITFQPPSADTPIPITYLQYKSSQTSGTLVTFQWYDVTDTTGLIITAGSVMRLLATSTTDSHPSGYVLSIDKARISIDTVNDTVLYYEEPTKKLVLVNSNPIQQGAIGSTCRDMIVKNKSRLTATSSSVIEVSDESIVTCTSSTHLRVKNNSNVQITNATYVELDNIQQNLTTLGFNLSNVKIDQTTSIGKVGQGTITGAKTCQAYNDFVDQVITLNTDANAFTVTLQNKITQANAEFRIKYKGTGTGNVITINNHNATLLYKINDTHKDYFVVFRYIISTGLFEFVRVEYGEGMNGVPYFPTPITNGQTQFPLPIPALVPTKLQMSVNGQEMYFGQNFTYSSGDQQVTFLEADFELSSTDVVKFVIF